LERTIKGVQKNHVKMAAAAATAVPRSILGEIPTEIENKLSGASAFIAPKHNVFKAIQHEKNQLKGFPPEPNKFDNLISIPDKFSVTSDGQPFLVFNEPVFSEDPSLNPKRILIFMSESSRLNLVTLFTLIIGFYHLTFVLSTFFPFDVLSFDVLSFDVLSHSAFCPLKFCPIRHFVLQHFVLLVIL
jgi:hypothetical protein